MEEIEIGSSTLVEKAPVVVDVDGSQYVLSVRDGELELFSAVCPHQGGRVRVADDETLRCPNHRWKFDAETGKCISGADAALTEIAVEKRDGVLYAVLPTTGES